MFKPAPGIERPIFCRRKLIGGDSEVAVVEVFSAGEAKGHGSCYS